MASFAAIVPSAADLADGFKFALGGVLIGVAFAGASEAIGNWVTHIAQVEDGSTPVNKGASLLLRMSSATIFYMAAERIMESVGRSVADPTGALFFNIAFCLGQPKLVASIVDTSGLVTTQTTKLLGLACCESCAESGGSCGGGSA